MISEIQNHNQNQSDCDNEQEQKDEEEQKEEQEDEQEEKQENHQPIMEFPLMRNKPDSLEHVHQLFQSLDMQQKYPRRLKFPCTKNIRVSQCHISNMPDFHDLIGNPKFITFVQELPGWYSFTEIVDYVQDHVWMHAHRINELSPFQNWIQNGCVNDGVSKFRPTIMKAMIQMFKGKHILDYCSGWGHRLVGAMSEDHNIRSYLGVDPNKKLHHGYDWMIRQFLPKSSRSKYRMICDCAEEIDYGKKQFDLIITSPPYFDLEIYDDQDETQSVKKYSSLDQWFDKFLVKATRNACNHLKRNGHLVLFVNDVPLPPPPSSSSSAQPPSPQLPTLQPPSSSPSKLFVQRFIEHVSEWLDMQFECPLVYGESLGYLQPIFVFRKIYSRLDG